MKKISKNVLLVSSVGLAGSAFAVTNTHPVFAASNASKKTTVANDQAKVKSAQKSVDQTQSKLTQVQNDLNTANKDLAQKETELANAKSTAEAANSKVAAPRIRATMRLSLPSNKPKRLLILQTATTKTLLRTVPTSKKT